MRKIRLWLPAIFWMMLIFFLSSQPSVKVTSNKILEIMFFKGLHILEYGILFFLIYRASKESFSFSFPKTIFLSFVLTLLYAFSDEIHQLFVPTREGRLRDVVIDGIGAFLASLVVKKKMQNDY